MTPAAKRIYEALVDRGWLKSVNFCVDLPREQNVGAIIDRELARERKDGGGRKAERRKL